MSYGTPGDARQSKNERRELARDKAKTLRDQQKKKEKRSKYLLQGGVVVVSLAIIAVIGVVIFSSIKTPTPGPRNMLSDGILIGEDYTATPTAALQPGEDPVPNVLSSDSDTIHIQMFVDYFCPVCGAFEDANADQLSTWIESGAASVEIFPIAILDRASQGTKYSTRAANAAACVADNAPDDYYAFNTVLFDNQPEEGTTGLTDEELIALTEEAGVSSPKPIAKCIVDQQFKSWVADARTRAQNGPIPNSDVDSVAGTPTIIVNGVKYTGALNDAKAFSSFVIQAENTNFNEKSTATPTPEPTETPATTDAPEVVTPEVTPAP
jgi:protein-disulfide isomerase